MTTPYEFGKFAAEPKALRFHEPESSVPPINMANVEARGDYHSFKHRNKFPTSTLFSSLFGAEGLDAKILSRPVSAALGHVAPMLPIPGASLIGPATGAASAVTNTLDDVNNLRYRQSIQSRVDKYNANPERVKEKLPAAKMKASPTIPASAVDAAAKSIPKSTAPAKTSPAKTEESKSTEPSTVSKVLNAVDPRKMDPRLLAALGIGGVGLGAGAYYLSRKKKKKPEDNSEKQSMLNDLMQFGAKVAQSTCSPCDMPNGPANKKHMTGASPAVTEAGEHSEEFGTPEVAETEHSNAKAKMPEEGAKSAYAFGYMLGR